MAEAAKGAEAARRLDVLSTLAEAPLTAIKPPPGRAPRLRYRLFAGAFYYHVQHVCVARRIGGRMRAFIALDAQHVAYAGLMGISLDFVIKGLPFAVAGFQALRIEPDLADLQALLAGHQGMRAGYPLRGNFHEQGLARRAEARLVGRRARQRPCRAIVE